MRHVARMGLVLWLAAVASAEARDFTGPVGPFEPGFWYNPEDSGWGLDLHLAGDRMVAAWATYDADGDPVWYLGIGRETGGEWRLDMKRHRWDAVADQYAGSRIAGELAVSFSGRESAVLNWNVDGLTGSSPIQPLLVDRTLTAEDYTGLWYAPELSGAGLSVHSQGPLQLLITYFYDRGGEPRWAFGTNRGDPAESRVTVKAYRRSCPGCAETTRENTEVGEVRFVFDREDLGRYSVDISATEVVDANWNRSEARLSLLTDLPSARPHEAALVAFTSEATLSEYLRQGMASRGAGPRIRMDDFSSPRPTVGPTRSQTNLQVEGVDEADVIKSSGDILYSLWPTPDEEKRHVLRAGRIGGAGYEEISRVRFGDAGLGALNGLYLTALDGGFGDQQLIAVAGGGYSVFSGSPLSIGPWYHADARTQVYFFDVRDVANPTERLSLEFDGSLVASRRVGGTLLLVTRFATSDLAVHNALEDGVDVQTPADLDLRHLGPAVRVNGGDPVALLDPPRTFLPPLPPGRRQAEMTSVIAIDLSDPAKPPEVVSIVGRSQAVHVSPDNLWVATTHDDYAMNFGTGEAVYSGDAATDVHRVSMQGAALIYGGSARVDGHLGYGLTDELRAFRLSEADGILRIVTTDAPWFSRSGEHLLTVLQSGALDSALAIETLSRLPNEARPEPIGKPGENLHGVRYVGDRAYLVTFKETDPLYAIDLSDLRDPRIAGELEITGFSDYLHPLPNDLLLGFGKEAVPAEDIADGNFAWFQGLQLSLFDVSDLSAPMLLDRVDLGRRGSDSSLRKHHGAFALVPAAEDRPTRIAIPVVLHDGDPVENPAHWYQWQRTGTAMFDVDTHARTLVARGVLTAVDAEADPNRDVWGDSEALAARTLLVGDEVYFYLLGQLWTGLWGEDGFGEGPK